VLRVSQRTGQLLAPACWQPWRPSRRVALDVLDP
jgi:hypothetical protein